MYNSDCTITLFFSATFKGVQDMPNARHAHVYGLVNNVNTGVSEIVAAQGAKVDIFNMETLSWRTAGTSIFSHIQAIPNNPASKRQAGGHTIMSTLTQNQTK
jgi:hypothetical protein